MLQQDLFKIDWFMNFFLVKNEFYFMNVQGLWSSDLHHC